MNKADILRDLTEPQREAVTHVEGPLLILAGAGSGKTRVVTRRVAWLLAEGVPPSEILAITFTNKAADEMRERVSALNPVRGLRISTFHAFCARELRRFADRLGLSPAYSIYDTDDKTKLLKQCIAALDYDTKTLKPAAVESAISRAKNDMLLPEDLSAKAGDYFEKSVAEVYTRYEKEMRSRHALDFDDLLLRMVELLRKDKKSRETLQKQFRYVMVDEYQDTNDAQYRIIHEITGKHQNLAVTGDPDQAIYGWRGANIHNILSFERDYPKAKTVLLERNYRSTKTILAAAHDVIVHNKLRKEKELFTENPEGTKLQLMQAGDEEMEAALVTDAVKRLLRKGFQPHDIAVFYRVNALSRTFEMAFRRERVPYRVIGGQEFFERREVRDVLCYLRLIANPADDLACERIVNVPARGIGGKSFDQMKGFALDHHVPFFEALRRSAQNEKLSDAAKTSAAIFVKIIDDLAAIALGPPSVLLKTMFEETGYLKQFSTSDEDRNRVLNAQEMVSTAADYESRVEGASLQGFLDEVSLSSDQDDLEDDSPTVSLMTLHAAKGLEFPAVFIVGLEEGILPHERSKESDSEREEERRLFYVGMTRAMKELFFSCALRRRRYGEFEDHDPSSFIAEIPRKYIEGADLGGAAYRERRDRERAGGLRGPQPPARPEPKETTNTLAAGDLVRHPQYGVGKVVSSSGSGEKLKVSVRFDSGATKTLMAAFAKLEKLVAK